MVIQKLAKAADASSPGEGAAPGHLRPAEPLSSPLPRGQNPSDGMLRRDGTLGIL
jgi:hypothetical protein